jgi:hypothetical protein
VSAATGAQHVCCSTALHAPTCSAWMEMLEKSCESWHTAAALARELWNSWTALQADARWNKRSGELPGIKQGRCCGEREIASAQQAAAASRFLSTSLVAYLCKVGSTASWPPISVSAWMTSCRIRHMSTGCGV